MTSFRKTTLLPTAAFALLSAVAVNAYAQSSVTLYGLVEDGLIYTNNQQGHANIQATTGQTNTSRFGVRGMEDLGGGYRAVFTLENGFDASTGKLGQGGLEFGRTASVGLATPYGTVTAGRQYEPVSEYLGGLSSALQWAGWTGAHPGDIDNMQSTIRFNNSVEYTSLTYGGFSFKAMFAPGGVAGDFSRARAMSFGAGWQGAYGGVSAAYLNMNDPSESAYAGSILPGQAGYTSPATSPIYRGYASADTLQIVGAGANLQFSGVRLDAIYTNTRYQNVVPTATTPYRGGTAQFNTVELNGSYRIVPSVLAGAAFIYTKGETANYLQWNLGADYALSKRTDIGLVGVWQRASGTDSTGKPAVASIASLTASSTNSQVAVRLNLRHRF
ncbi:gram-negative porin family protein [Paraburkholderia xenovorans LB400]|uniref:Outer membrane porin, OmpC family n=1 Tax=Paraburkholderia xenovorans (strain LB400) TaxID=266265 RepID=Q13GI8_PARXL|nr:porin [Paraburkholderia xenovorans]ABE36801.1 outer membrane porin, OmpC family [Paraburkholderia xenovorans LB400]AIP34478.1 gram-negative porin family protein [Paraburkholderia xenovorans LB400]